MMTEREALEWMAQARPGDAIPEGFPDVETLRLLVKGLGYQRAYKNDIMDGVDLSAWARAWLAEHPAA